MKFLLKVAFIVSFVFTSNSYADCVFGAKNKTKYNRLDNNTIILSGGFGSEIMIKTFCFISPASSVKVLKDSFCSYESSVLYIDGEVCDVNNVSKLN